MHAEILVVFRRHLREQDDREVRRGDAQAVVSVGVAPVRTRAPPLADSLASSSPRFERDAPLTTLPAYSLSVKSAWLRRSASRSLRRSRSGLGG